VENLKTPPTLKILSTKFIISNKILERAEKLEIVDWGVFCIPFLKILKDCVTPRVIYCTI